MALTQQDWQQIETVLLDMDGTLLDLHFDNYFWLKHVPMRYAEKYGLTPDETETALAERYRQIEGTLNWYCIEHWSEKLGLDIAALKRECAHLIAIHPYVEDFLVSLRDSGKRILLVTNAHGKSLELKMEVTQLTTYFDRLVCSHDLGLPKEDPAFWESLQKIESYNPARTLLVDDSDPVLQSAHQYGIAYQLAIALPDSKNPPKSFGGFKSILHFGEVLPCC